LTAVQEDAVERLAKAPTLSPVEASDAEDEIADWVDARGLRGGWDLAPTLGAAGVTPGWLDDLAERVAPEHLEGGLRWITYALETELLMNEIEDATRRISTLVGAARQYSQLDRAPYRDVDVHEGLKSTLAMLAAKLVGITVVKEFDRTLPPIPAYAGELNQVWTNLVDNAVAAMRGDDGEGTGSLTLRTARDGDCLLVEIGDTGPGIAPDVVPKIIEPFFTTKPVGQGTGLGLDISYRIVVQRHRGDLRVESRPGDTRFQVRLPLVVPPEQVDPSP
jgi:signal transduction histidine kinase